MNSFKDYVIEEFKEQAKDYVGTEFKFSHGISLKKDKKTQSILNIDVIKVGIKFYDKDMNLLTSKTLIFENNDMNKRVRKSLINISPDELINRFNGAKDEICQVIMNDLMSRGDEIGLKVKSLQRYHGSKGEVIPTEFKGESVNVREEEQEVKGKRKVGKKQFDM